MRLKTLIRPYQNIWQFCLGVLVFTFLITRLTPDTLPLNNIENVVILLLYGFGFGISTTFGVNWIWEVLDKRYDWIKDLWKRVIFGFILIELWVTIAFIVVAFIFQWIFWSTSLDDLIYTAKNYIYIPAIMAIPLAITISAIAFFKNWKNSFQKREKLKAEMMSYKYEALHNQLNPHFLFNSFNVLNSLVYEDRNLAIKFIDQLSDLYERVLKSKDKELIPLKEEVAFIEAYAFLLKTRFENKLDINIDFSPSDEEFIIPMVLQLLIENAVKHNTVSKSAPLQINIHKKNGVLEISNTLKAKKVGEDSKGTGLQNIQLRYQYFTDIPIEIQKTEKEFLVRVPILKKAG